MQAPPRYCEMLNKSFIFLASFVLMNYSLNTLLSGAAASKGAGMGK